MYSSAGAAKMLQPHIDRKLDMLSHVACIFGIRGDIDDDVFDLCAGNDHVGEKSRRGGLPGSYS